MSLLGAPLLVLLGLAAAGIPVVTYLFWSRVHGARAVRLLARGGLLVAGQFAAVLLLAALLNDYSYFYGSWSDLLGQNSGSPARASAATPHPAVRVASGPRSHAPEAARWGAVKQLTDPGWSGPSEWAVRGRVESVRVSGSRSGLTSHAFVYLPPQYFQPAAARRQFPAVIVMTGYPGNDRGLVERMKWPDRLLQEIRSGRAGPMLFVMLRPTVVFPRDTECTDVPGGPQVETFLSADLPAAIGHAYRVRPMDWAAMGDSTGGYCAAKIAMNHSDRFAQAVALSGYFHTLADRTTGDLWGGSPVLRNLNDLEWRLRHQPPPPVSLLVTSSIGERGPNGYVDTKRFLSLVRPPMHADQIILPRGGHTFSTWSQEAPTAIDWLSRHQAAAMSAHP